MSFKDLENYYKTNLNSKNSSLFAICDKKNRHIGNCSISQIDWINRRCSYGRLIGENFAVKGAGTEALKLLQNYVFQELNLNSMWSGLIIYLQKSNKAGMIKTGYFKAFYRSGKYYDVEIFQLQSKYLRINSEK